MTKVVKCRRTRQLVQRRATQLARKRTCGSRGRQTRQQVQRRAPQLARKLTCGSRGRQTRQLVQRRTPQLARKRTCGLRGRHHRGWTLLQYIYIYYIYIYIYIYISLKLLFRLRGPHKQQFGYRDSILSEYVILWMTVHRAAVLRNVWILIKSIYNRWQWSTFGYNSTHIHAAAGVPQATHQSSFGSCSLKWRPAIWQSESRLDRRLMNEVTMARNSGDWIIVRRVAEL